MIQLDEINSNDLAWKVIAHMVKADYGGDEKELRDEVGDLNEYAFKISLVIDDENLFSWADDIVGLTSQIELAM